MPRLRNRASGAVVNVDDRLASRLGPDWEPAGDGGADTTSRPRRRTRGAHASGDDNPS
ncbi:DUF7302 family protein [Segniliparus rotundus]|uniref:DUF7302 family protein n=1 Tax=Segniliparus rotundus TaxID=286802 RepID=UPI003CCB3311